MLKESGKQIKTTQRLLQKQANKQTKTLPPPSPRAVSSPRGCWRDHKTLGPLGRLSPQHWSLSNRQARGTTSEREGEESCPRPELAAFSWHSLEVAGKGGALGGSEFFQERKDSLLMRRGRWLAEGALREGSGRSETGTLSGHRGNSHLLSAAPAPSAQAHPEANHSFRGETSEVKTPCGTRTSLPAHSGLHLRKQLLPLERPIPPHSQYRHHHNCPSVSPWG